MSSRITLLNSQKDQVYRALLSRGFTPEEFSWETTRGYQYSSLIVESLVLETKNGRFFFSFDRAQEPYKGLAMAAVYSPGKEESQEASITGDWQQTLLYFHNWLSYLEREKNAKNYWSKRIAEEFEREWQADDERFTEDQLKSIDRRLKVIEKSLKQMSTGDKQALSSISEDIRYLKEQAREQKKRDWFFLFVGVVFSRERVWSVGYEGAHRTVSLLFEAISSLP